MMFVRKAAMLLWFDVIPEAIVEHDEWHTREHFPERIAIPGFRRASRWIARGDAPRYLVCYEVDDVAVLSSPAYLERLNDPSEWTRRMMPGYQGMTRAFFQVRHLDGEVLGSTMLSVRFEPDDGQDEALHNWLTGTLMPELRTLAGVTGCAFLVSEQATPMTAEQRIRGRDASARCVLLVSLYDAAAAELLAQRLASGRFASSLVKEPQIGNYTFSCMSTSRG